MPKNISFSSLNQTVQCKVEMNGGSVPVKMFGISSTPYYSYNIVPEDNKFLLFPKKADNSGFLGRIVDPQNKNKQSAYSLFYSQKIADNGFRFSDAACWKDMVKLFSNPLTHVETVPIMVDDTITQHAPILGTISLQ